MVPQIEIHGIISLKGVDGMKRLILGLVIGLFIGSAVTAIASTNQTVQAIFKDVNFKVDDQDPVELTFLLHQGASYLPVRKAGEVLGYEVDYQTDPETIIYRRKGDEQMLTQTNSVTNEWISLRDLADQGIDVIVKPDNMLLIRSGESTVEFLTTDIKENESVELIFDGISFEVKSDGKSTYLKAEDLRRFGIID